jgi:AcrR family transcriptional regulator
MVEKRKRGVSKAEWIEQSLNTLAEGNINDVTIVAVARSLGISKAGFYWHFNSRAELLDEILKSWIHEVTEVVTSNKLIDKIQPKKRLVKLAEMLLDYDLGRYEMPIRQWARKDESARKAVRRADKIRFSYIRRAFEELGFMGEELELRTMLYIGYHSGEGIFLNIISKKARRRLIQRRIDLLTSK